MKKFLLIFSLIIFAYSEELSINDEISSFSLANQFNQKKTIDSNINILIVSFEKIQEKK